MAIGDVATGCNALVNLKVCTLCASRHKLSDQMRLKSILKQAQSTWRHLPLVGKSWEQVCVGHVIIAALNISFTLLLCWVYRQCFWFWSWSPKDKKGKADWWREEEKEKREKEKEGKRKRGESSVHSTVTVWCHCHYCWMYKYTDVDYNSRICCCWDLNIACRQAELVIMDTLCNRADHYIFALWFVSFFFFFS